MSDLVRIEERGDVALVTIDRQPANAMDGELLEAGHAVLGDLAGREPGAVVLAGREGFFSAGVDLKYAPTLDEAGQREMVGGINRLFAGWYSFGRPVVAAVTGHAIAGGFILALCADWRVVSTEGKFGLTELRAGIPYPGAAMLAVRAELDPAAARRFVLRADLVDSRTALDAGVFDELAEPTDVVPRALAVAAELAALPRAAYATIKHQLRGDTIAAMERVLAEGDTIESTSWLNDETAEAAARTLRGG